MAVPPELRTDRVALRPWTESDVDVVMRAARDAEIARYSSVGSAVTSERALEWISARQEPDRLDWIVSGPEGAVGRVSLAHIDHGEGVAEVGYWTLAESRRRGFASLALGLVEAHAFTELTLGRLVIRHEPDNTASCAFADRRGYRAEGTQRGAFVRGGVRHDLHVHGLLVDDPRDR